MKSRELEQLGKDSIYTMRVNSDLKDQVINRYLNDLVKIVRKEVKGKSLAVIVIEVG
jgi:hypothetical protein